MLQTITANAKPGNLNNNFLISYNKLILLYCITNIFADEIIKTEMNPTRVLFAVENPNIYKEDLIDIQLAYKHLKHAFNKEGNVLDFPDAFKRDIPMFAVEQLRKVCILLGNEEVKASN